MLKEIRGAHVAVAGVVAVTAYRVHLMYGLTTHAGTEITYASGAQVRIPGATVAEVVAALYGQ